MDIQNQRIYEEVCKLNLPVVSAGSSFPKDFSGKMSGELNEEINEQLNEDFIAEMQTRMDFVDCNIESCAQRLISSYIRNGRKRIAWAGNPEVSPELYQAVQKVLGRFGLTADVSGESFMHDLFICDSDWTAIRLMQKAQAFGYNIPEEFSVVGFGNIPESTHVLPALTTIQMPWSQVGTSAARCILERLQNPELPYVSMNYCANLIKRDSAT